MPQGVRADLLADSGAAGDSADDPGGTVPVQPPPLRGKEERSFGALADGQVDGVGGARGERDGDDLASLAGDDQGPEAPLQAEMLDVSPGGVGHPQPVQREQRNERVLGGIPGWKACQGWLLSR